VLLFDTCGPRGDTPKGLQVSAFITEPLIAGTRLVRLNGGTTYKGCVVLIPDSDHDLLGPILKENKGKTYNEVLFIKKH
jgi:hypothetical protein